MRIETKTRRGFKKAAKINLKAHYFSFILMCLFAALIGSEFVTSENLIGLRTDPVTIMLNGYEEAVVETEREAAEMAGGSTFADKVMQFTSKIQHDEQTSKIFSRSAGTINQVIDAFTTGTAVSTISSVVLNIVGSESVADTIMMSLASVLAVWFWMFVQLVYMVVMRRNILEGRIYKKVSINRYLFIFRTKSWLNVALSLTLMTIFDVLSIVTIVGFPIVYYGLFMVPFVVAENPKIKPWQAIKLSWNITKGYKMDLFINDLTMFGWRVLSVITLGLSDLFFCNPYKLAVHSEFYAVIRKNAIENSVKGCELLNDRYLFEKADMGRLRGSYPEAVNVLASPEYSLQGLTGAKKFFAEHFGVVLWNTEDELKYEENQASRQRIKNMRDELEGISYPTRLAPLPESHKSGRFANMHYMRHYSLLSLVLMFFIYSGFGWVWEVFYYYLLQGHYINRGVMHGPWLPIYGAGGIAILIFLFPLRKSPSKHFFATMGLCGILEYGTSVVLEYALGAQWWNYDGFFLNLNGRICAEGLLIFGVAGLAFIYFLSPILDDVIRKFKPSKLLPIAIILVTIFVFDLIYSTVNPNKGEGITDGFAGSENRIVQTVEETY
ncbi:MAG: DUF975 family protein [Saccharofermentans sp.]|nr:DUF975 family protein [Saccharofermentans sp.]